MTMTKAVVFLIILLIQFSVSAQLIMKPIPQKQFANRKNTTDTTITLPIYEDFSRGNTPDPNIWEFGSSVQISPTAGLNPPTINVAVMDGVDALGVPYDITSGRTNPADSLISYPIAMTRVPVNKRNTIYMSFFWQAKGLGEMPDETDSLTLQFLNSDSVWVHQNINTEDFFNHGLVGGENALKFDPEDTTQLIFQQVILPITDNSYHHDNFRIKFQNYGSTQGPFDSWILDYIYINYDRGPDSIYYRDRAMTMLPTSPFGEFYSVPFDHYEENSGIFTNGMIMESNYLQEPLTPQALSFDVNILDANKNIVGQINRETEILGGSTMQRIKFSSAPLNISDYFATNDTLQFYVQAILISGDTTVPNSNHLYSYQHNDTISRSYTLERHYAYDDGTAEFAAGISINQGRLVVAYPIHSRDTLTHIDINFPQIVPGQNADQLDILVLKDLSGSDESVLVNQQGYRLTQASELNEFTRIKLKVQPIVEDTIYIGFEQKVNRYVPVGLDKNTDFSSRIYTRIDEEWEQNESVAGTLMIRPVFGEPFLPVSSKDQLEEVITLYPNPARSRLHIKGGSFESIKVFDLRGVEQSVTVTNDTIDIQQLQSGIYIALFSTISGTRAIRFIKQ